MRIGWQLQWFDITYNTLLSDHILMLEVYAMLENVHLAKAKGYPMVSFQTDSLSIKGIPKDVNFYLDQTCTIINAEGWSYDFVHRQSNMPTDFLANYVRGLNEKSDWIKLIRCSGMPFFPWDLKRYLSMIRVWEPTG